MNLKDKAFHLGVKMAKKGVPLADAMRRCPYQSSPVRQAFIDGWRSILDPQ